MSVGNETWHRDTWIFIDERYIDEKLAVFDGMKSEKSNRIEKVLQYCMNAVDETCVRFCSRGLCGHDESTEETQSSLPQSSVQRLESLNIHPSVEDVHQFASKGGFYDGTFPLDDEDLWDAAKQQDFDDVMLSPRLSPPPACPSETRITIPQKTEAIWWSSKRSRKLKLWGQ
mmetsp:Transcript_39153/g.55115  ORF Transcript_39153/g.55115 Transcript_39153/m.55115 type:complete len:172 (-) Transcript_39153:64-579(-)